MCLVQTVSLYLRDERKPGGVSDLTAFICRDILSGNTRNVGPGTAFTLDGERPYMCYDVKVFSDGEDFSTWPRKALRK